MKNSIPSRWLRSALAASSIGMTAVGPAAALGLVGRIGELSGVVHSISSCSNPDDQQSYYSFIEGFSEDVGGAACAYSPEDLQATYCPAPNCDLSPLDSMCGATSIARTCSIDADCPGSSKCISVFHRCTCDLRQSNTFVWKKVLTDSDLPNCTTAKLPDRLGRRPCLQDQGDPCPGYLISKTELSDPSNNPYTRKYVDSLLFPYIVATANMLGTGGKTQPFCKFADGVDSTRHVQLGDFAEVSYQGKTVGAIVGDARGAAGPTRGAGSRALRLALGIPSEGVKTGVYYKIFCGSADADKAINGSRAPFPLGLGQIEEQPLDYEKCPKGCSDHGICDKKNCTCDCHTKTTGWAGNGCEKPCPGRAIGEICGGHGSCDETTAICACDPGWGPPKGPVDPLIAGTCSCPLTTNGLACSGHGKCNVIVDPYGMIIPMCACEPGWRGFDCSLVDCVDQMPLGKYRLGDPSIPCGGNGTCQPSPNGPGSSGTCECKPGYDPKFDCGAYAGWCVNPNGDKECSGHGHCNYDANVATPGTCVCDDNSLDPYPPIFCSAKKCPISKINGAQCGGAKVLWSGNTKGCTTYGYCNNGTCVCSTGDGWGGAACDVPLCPATYGMPCGGRALQQGCQNNGACVSGKCVCFNGNTPQSGCTQPPPACGGTCGAPGTCVNNVCMCTPHYGNGLPDYAVDIKTCCADKDCRATDCGQLCAQQGNGNQQQGPCPVGQFQYQLNGHVACSMPCGPDAFAKGWKALSPENSAVCFAPGAVTSQDCQALGADFNSCTCPGEHQTWCHKRCVSCNGQDLTHIYGDYCDPDFDPSQGGGS
jgi:hypothetical protein